MKNTLLIGAGIIGLGNYFITKVVGGLFVKNLINEKKARVLTKEELIAILKIIRKEKYLLYKQVSTFSINITQQMKGNINQQAIEEFINGPQCPFKFKDGSDKIIDQVCSSKGITNQQFTLALQNLGKDPEIIRLVTQQAADYRGSLGGRLPHFDVRIPPILTKEKFYQLQNQITKKIYMQQVRVFKKLQQHSQLQIQQNPGILQDLGNPEAENEQMLRNQGLGSEFEPAYAVYEAAIVHFKNDLAFQTKIRKLQQGYQSILYRYIQRIQTKTITDRELTQLQEQILYYQPV